MARTVTINFDTFGNIQADATGFTGTACEEATRNILAGLADVKSDNKKPEYYMQGEAQQSAMGGLQLGSLG